MGGVSVGSVLEIINLAFGIRPCDKKLNPEKCLKPCLNYHIKKCYAPCAGIINQEDYKTAVMGAINFLNGDVIETEKLLKEKMFSASEKEEFELALKYKENLLSLEKIKQKRLTSLNKFLDADVIAFASNGIYSTVNMLFVRKGNMLGAKNFSFESACLTSSDALREFILQYYKKDGDVPEELYVGMQRLILFDPLINLKSTNL